MFGNSAFGRVRQMFADQFEADGDGFLYRKSSKGAPIRVTAVERDTFVAAFNRQVRWMLWTLVGAMLAIVAALTAWDLTTGQDAVEVPLYVGTGIAVAIYMLAWFHVWNTPARALAGRNAMGASRSTSEARRLALQRTTWGQLFGSVGTFLVGLLYLSRRQNLLVGWSRLWLVFGALVILLAAYRAFQKWRLDQAEDPD